jgi:hypothetical protein
MEILINIYFDIKIYECNEILITYSCDYRFTGKGIGGGRMINLFKISLLIIIFKK